MIVWLSSFPRSGNTFFRIALHRLYRVPTYVVYDVDGVAEQIGTDLMDARARPGTFEAMRASPEVYFVKTHRRRDDPVIDDQDRAICLVRDGRDCVVSWARLWTAGAAGEETTTRIALRRKQGRSSRGAVAVRRHGARTCSLGASRLLRGRSGCDSRTSSPIRRGR